MLDEGRQHQVQRAPREALSCPEEFWSVAPERDRGMILEKVSGSKIPVPSTMNETISTICTRATMMARRPA